FLLGPGSAGFSGQLIVEIAFSAILGGLLFNYLRQVPSIAPTWLPWMPDKALTPWERFGRLICLVVGLASLVAALAHYVLVYRPLPGWDFFHPSLIAIGSAVKLGLLGLCTLIAVRDVRRYREFITVFILGNAVSLVIVFIAHLGINHFGSIPFPA